MQPFEQQILLNQIAQGARSLEEGIHQLQSLDVEGRRGFLNELAMMISQARPQDVDISLAISAAGLKPTYTPCVLLTKDRFHVQAPKVVALPEDEQEKSLRLFIVLFRIADERRRKRCKIGCRHWWHRDLSDPNILKDIRENWTSL